MKTTKNNRRRARNNRGASLVLSLALICALIAGGVFTFGSLSVNRAASAEVAQVPVSAPVEDNSPAIYVAQKNANSVVGIITSTEGWTQSGGVQNTMVGQGSGVVIAEGGYVLTNNHVIEDGSAFQVLMPNGDKVDATLVGADSAMDLAVLKVNDEADKLVPVTIGASESLPVGSTVIAIGNPGGEILANTVTRGIISALERSSVSSNNTTRNVNYIQHDAPISSGNSGGGLFDYQGNLIGINTLKYGGSYYSSGSFEGLGFAIPIETAYPIAQQLIENGKVIRPQMAAGKRVIIAAHGNSLRALVKYFDNISDEDIIGVNIPTGVPLVYEFDDDFKVIRSYYLGDQEALKAKMEAVANQGKKK